MLNEAVVNTEGERKAARFFTFGKLWSRLRFCEVWVRFGVVGCGFCVLLLFF